MCLQGSNVGLYKIICTVPILCVAVGISVFSHMPSPPVGDFGFEFQDKLLHAAAYLCFGVSLSLALHAWKPGMPKRRFMWTVVLATALFGVYDEVHQSFVPNRQAGIDDWIADCIGGVLSLFFRSATARLAAFVQQFFSQSGR